MLNSVCKNFKSVYLFQDKSFYYIEKPNFFNYEYAQFLKFINHTIQTKEKHNKKIKYSIDNFDVEVDSKSTH